MRIITRDTPRRIDEIISINGWIDSRRDHGSITFIDLRDRWGKLQVVLSAETEGEIKELRPEDVVKITGKIVARPEKLLNPSIITGSVELQADKIEILSSAKTPPFEIDKDTINVDEELRLKYRYLDIRSSRVTNNLIMRHRIGSFFRNFLNEREFINIETPFLTKGTPEGSREFIVPSRLHAQKFYVLPQSPQQYKQLLMTAGIDKYYQIVRCFRDEDQRGDRQPEFTQLDIEMSFVNAEDVMSINEEMVNSLIRTMFPDYKITETPWPRITYKEAMAKFNSDKPDLRINPEDSKELAFAWVIDQPVFEYSETYNKLVSVHHPFTRPRDEDLSVLDKTPEMARAYSYDMVLNGSEIAGGSIRILDRELQNRMFKILGLEAKEIDERFGHLLEAFEYGVPPHGGIAFGLDRFVMILQREPNIREVIAFPKTGDAREPMTGAPTIMPEENLKEVHIKI